MSTTNWGALVAQTDERMRNFREAIDAPAKAFGGLAKAAIAEGALSSKTKELIALAIGVTCRCDGCLAYHVAAARRFGATREEVAEALAVAVYMGGGPSMIYGAEALSAFDEMEKSGA